MNYNGKATIDFPIYREDASGEEQELTLKITGSSYFTQGKYYGPPEDSYPDDGGTEILSILLDGMPWRDTLTKAETQDAEEQIQQAVQEGDDCDPPSLDYDDSDDFDDGLYDYSEV